MTKSRTWQRTFALFLLCSSAVIGSAAQTVTTLASFEEFTTGEDPYFMSLTQGLDGNFYGTAQAGANLAGTVFKVSPSGTLSTVYTFCAQTNCADGSLPFAGLLLATDGNFYGTTGEGGDGKYCSAGEGVPCGTVFRITPSGMLTTLYSFCAKAKCADGELPSGGLVQATDGNFYGTTRSGGRGQYCLAAGAPCGTVFKITPDGALTTLYSFCGQPFCLDGAEPVGALIQAKDGSLYGTTYSGGAYGNGVVFKILRNGTFATVHSLQFFEGANPVAGVIQATDGNFYGSATQGGIHHDYGTVYKMTSTGTVRAHSFNGADGITPYGALVQGTDGNFYGTTGEGGSGNGSSIACNPPRGCGTLFRITSKGSLTSLYSFCLQANCPDGAGPAGGLVQGTDGNFYGTTSAGGSNNNGTVFVLSVGLGPFVKTLPTSGKVGAPVIILGTNLTGASSVTFNGTPATFTVVSSSEITTAVPTGATSGTVQLTTASSVLLSNVRFQVRP